MVIMMMGVIAAEKSSVRDTIAPVAAYSEAKKRNASTMPHQQQRQLGGYLVLYCIRNNAGKVQRQSAATTAINI